MLDDADTPLRLTLLFSRFLGCKISLDCVNGMGVDALDDPLFPVGPKSQRSDFNESFKPLIGSVFVVVLLPLSQFKCCLNVLID